MLYVDSNTVTNIENVITTGECLALINFDQDLLRLIEPLIQMKHEALVMNRLYKKHIFNEEERETKKSQRNQSI